MNEELHLTCLRCGRKLKTEESQILGFGKICFEKAQRKQKVNQLFEVEANGKCD